MPKRTAPTLVLLVRHGVTATTGARLPGRAAGLHLNERGRAQAEATAERIGALGGITAVYASPLERTRETASPIARSVGCRVRTDRALLDLDVGDWTGMRLATAQKRPEWAAVQRTPSMFTFPGGESFTAMSSRVTGAVDRLVAAHPGQRIVIVTHADPIKAIVAHASGTHLDAFQRLVIAPCSVSAIVIGGTTPIVVTVNHTGDLATMVAP